jgi:cytochrome P450
MAAAAEVPGVDLLDPALYRNGMPHELYAELRDKGPVLWHPRTHVPAFGRDIEFWAVIGHREVEQANRDWETFSVIDGTTIVPFPPKQRGIMFVTKDPPEYNRIRRLISAGFTPRMVGRLEEQIRVRTERILDDAAAAGEIDFVPDVAYQLPMHVIADIVGIPEEDRPEVFRITDLIMRSRSVPGDLQGGTADSRGSLVHLRSRAERSQTSQADRRRVVDPRHQRARRIRAGLFFTVLTFAGSETTRFGRIRHCSNRLPRRSCGGRPR